MLATSWLPWRKRIYLTNLSFTVVKPWVTKNDDVMTKNGSKKRHKEVKKHTHAHTKKTDFIVVFWFHGHPKTSVLLKQNHRLRILTSKNTVSWGSFFSTFLSGKSNFFMFRYETWWAQKPVFYKVFSWFSLWHAKSGPKKNPQKTSKKYRKKHVLTLRNLCFTEAKLWIIEKPFGPQKTKRVFGLAFWGGPGAWNLVCL